MPRTSNQNAGLTLIELVITLAVFAVTVTVVAPAMQSLLHGNRLEPSVIGRTRGDPILEPAAQIAGCEHHRSDQRGENASARRGTARAPD